MNNSRKEEKILTRQQNSLIKGGAVFLMSDELVVFPKERLGSAGDRNLHPFRWAIVLLGPGYQKLEYPLVQVIPCTASSAPGDGETAIPQEEMRRSPCIFDKPHIVAYTNLVQPCLKVDLAKFMGDLLPDTYGLLCNRVARVQGLKNVIQAANVQGDPLSPGGLKLPPRTATATPANTGPTTDSE